MLTSRGGNHTMWRQPDGPMNILFLCNVLLKNTDTNWLCITICVVSIKVNNLDDKHWITEKQCIIVVQYFIKSLVSYVSLPRKTAWIAIPAYLLKSQVNVSVHLTDLEILVACWPVLSLFFKQYIYTDKEKWYWY